MYATVYIDGEDVICLGALNEDGPHTLDELYEIYAIDADQFREEFGIEFDERKLHQFEVDDAEDRTWFRVNSLFPIVVNTPNGSRYLEVPDFGESVWTGIEVWDIMHGSALYDLLDTDDIVAVGKDVTNPRPPALDMDADLCENRIDRVTATVRVSGAGNSLALNVTSQLRMLGVDRGDYVKVAIERADRKA